MENRNCENCVHAQPFGGDNDNRCDAWECEFIDRTEAAKAYKAKKDRIILRCNTFMPKEDFEKIKKEWEAQDPALLVIPCSMEVIPPYVRGKWTGGKKYRWVKSISMYWHEALECSVCGEAGIKEWKFCPNCGARMED